MTRPFTETQDPSSAEGQAPDNQQRWLTLLAVEAVREGRFRTQRELADAAGFSASLLSLIASGRRIATPAARRALAAALAGGPEAGEELLAVLTATSYSEGVDIPRLTQAIMRNLPSSHTAVIQRVGRAGRWDNQFREQQLTARTERYVRSLGTVLTGPIHVGELTVRPDFYIPALDLAFEVKLHVNRQDSLEAAIGSAVLAKTTLGAKVVVVTEERPADYAEQALRGAGLVVAWFDNDELVGEGLQRLLKPPRSR